MKFNEEKFEKAKEHFNNIVEELTSSVPKLKSIQQRLVDEKYERYNVETPIVYNDALKDVKPKEIKLILVADNPGRHEQEKKNSCYLVDSEGSAGRKARELFDNDSRIQEFFGNECRIDFENDVIILNKTPIFSPCTKDLRKLCQMEKEDTGGDSIKKALNKSQEDMAEILFKFHEALNVPVWIVGKSKMGSIFKPYTDELKSFYLKREQMYKQIYFYHHFSRSCFTTDLKGKDLESLGKKYREEVLGKIIKQKNAN